jgi:hypothetical protein
VAKLANLFHHQEAQLDTWTGNWRS